MESKKNLLNTFFGFGMDLGEEENNDKEQGLELNKFKNSDDEVQIISKEEAVSSEEKKPTYEETYQNLLKEEEEEKKEPPKKEAKLEKIILGRKEVDDSDVSTYQNIVARVKKFEDTKKIAEYIRNDKIVTLNIEDLDTETAQRVVDFLSGAMSVKEASFVEISRSVYVSVPKNQRVLFEGEKERKERIFGRVGI